MPVTFAKLKIVSALGADRSGASQNPVQDSGVARAAVVPVVGAARHIQRRGIANRRISGRIRDLCGIDRANRIDRRGLIGRNLAVEKLGIAIAEMTRMIATTMSNSMRENPRSCI